MGRGIDYCDFCGAENSSNSRSVIEIHHADDCAKMRAVHASNARHRHDKLGEN
jgi:hypothetical protein